MTRLFCLALMLFGLGACGENNAVNPMAPAAPPPTVNGIGELVDCGEIVIAENPRAVVSDQARAAQSIACFKNRYEKCNAPAFVSFREQNTSVIRRFTINPGASCQLTQALQTDPNSPPAVVDCKTARVENNALVIAGCSHLGDFILTP